MTIKLHGKPNGQLPSRAYSVVLPAVAAALLAGCAPSVSASAPQTSATAEPTVPQITTIPVVKPRKERITGMDSPSTPADLPQTASVLETERYRPSYNLQGTADTIRLALPPTGAFGDALAQAKAYSDANKGLGLVVYRKGILVHKSFADGVSGSSTSASASMMKSVLALLYGIAIEDGVIGSVDDPVGDYISEWKGDPRGDITLRQMLTMSAGLGTTSFMQTLLGPDIGGAALAMEKVAEPDTEFVYNNAISKVLAMALDRQLKAKGKGGLLPFLQEELWTPLGNGPAKVWIGPKGEARGYAGLHAGLWDWARIGEMIRKGGKVGKTQVVPASWIAEMAKPSKANAQYGLHVWLGGEHTPARAYSATNPIKIPHKEPFVDKDIVYFDGFGGQRVYIIPSKGLVIARIGEVNLAYDDSVIPNLLSRAAE